MFAFGQTGSGKTYTMTGVEDNDDQEGIIPRVCRSLFTRAVDGTGGGVGSQRANLTSIAHPGASGSTFTVSYVEIYCEKVGCWDVTKRISNKHTTGH